LERYEIFKDNLDKIHEHNSKKLSWTAGINEFTDLNREEFGHFLRAQSAGYRPSMSNRTKKYTTADGPATCTSVNWANTNNPQGAARVTPVKNQGQCGSCWAFSTTGSVEGRIAIANNAAPTSLSEMNLVDCSHQNNGCNGGLMDNAFEYIISNNGLCTEEAYPYTAPPKHWFCQAGNCDKSHGEISSYQDVSKTSSAMKTALCSGPVSIAIEADQDSFQMYESGVFDGSCGDQLDHGVLAAGFGTWTDGQGYWRVKNSWGESWGMSGYILIKNDDHVNGKTGNRCGILESASYPIV